MSKNTPTTTEIPHEIVTELLGNFTFSSSPEADLQTVEQIAGRSYTSWKSLVDTIRGEVRTTRGFDKKIKALESNPFYSKYATA